MSEASLVLFIDLKPDSRIDLRAAAKASIAWADLVEEVSFHFDPLNAPKIELERANPGSQKLKTIVTAITDDPKASIRTAIISALVFIGGTSVRWGWEQVLEYMSGPDAPQIEITLSEEDRLQIAHEVARLLQTGVGQPQAQEVYGALETDPNVTGAGVSGTTEGRPKVIVARPDFPKRQYIEIEEGTERQIYMERMDLVLLRAVLTDETNKRWGFNSERGKFGATIKDESFLQRLALGQLNIPMTQGIHFNVDLEVTETRVGEVWQVKEYTITKVHNVVPPLIQQRFGLGVLEGDNSADDDN